MIAVGLSHFAGEADGLVNSPSRNVGGGTEIRVTNHIEIGEASQAQSFPQPTAAGAFEIDQEVGVIAQIPMGLVSEIERFDQRGFVFAGIVKAVRALIGRMETGLALKDGVGLA